MNAIGQAGPIVFYSCASTSLSLAVSIRVKAVAIALLPRLEQANIQFIHSKVTGFTREQPIYAIEDFGG
jgi:hypothetical protein